MGSEKLTLLDTSGTSPLVKTLEDFLKSEIKGQDLALVPFIESYEIKQAGLKRDDEPISVSICVGPSGTGKTLLAETLALHFFGNRYGFTKIECASFAERHEYSKLIGSPAGYVGYDDEPMLSQRNIDKHHYEAILKKTGYKEMLEKIGELSRHIKELKQLEKELNELRFKFFNPQEGMHQTNPDYKRVMRGLVKVKDLLRKNEGYRNKLISEAARLEEKHGNLEYSEDQNYLSIILFDEVEKADSSLHNLMLEIMDKARITLNSGKATRFNNSVIILTSNKGSVEMSELLEGRGERIGFVTGSSTKQDQTVFLPEKKEFYQKLHTQAVESLKSGFAPEFLARLDNILVFQPLDKKDLQEILELRLRDLGILLNERAKPLQVVLDEAAKEYFVDQALQYRTEGARGLKKQIRRHLTLNIAKLFNHQTIKAGDRLVVKFDGKDFLFYRDLNDSDGGGKEIIKKIIS